MTLLVLSIQIIEEFSANRNLNTGSIHFFIKPTIYNNVNKIFVSGGLALAVQFGDENSFHVPLPNHLEQMYLK